MATTDLPCQHDVTPACTDLSYSKCPHCSLNLCLEHILEHQLLVRLDFNETIDLINQQKLSSNDHSVVNEMKVKALEQLDSWKTTKIELVLSIYNGERHRVENIWEECIELNGLSAAIQEIEKDVNVKLNAIATEIQLPEIIELTQRLKFQEKVFQELQHTSKQKDQMILAHKREYQILSQQISEKNVTISNLTQRLRMR
ncbi:hypothetical protein I4U23_002857 [Adineta vaga]|nr:hypothetical protein I4U23_002857 [Adineta vaga]